nr:LuxR C-terminal-related transcriptional regulator [Serratia fonticola]
MMINIQFTLLDSDNFYQQGLRYIVKDYLDSLNEYYRLYPRLAPVELNALEGIEIIFRSQEEGWGCACCYQSTYHTPRHKQMTVIILDKQHNHSLKHPAQFSIHRQDSVPTIRQKLQMAVERFCHQPWVALHASGLHQCQRCRIAGLSNCEKKVLKLMSTGMSASTIADMLHRSQKTISAHKRSAMRKLNVNKSTELNKVLLNQMGLG